MILKTLPLCLLLKLFCSVLLVESQNERSYNTNDWVPITPSPNARGGDQDPKKPIGRVLNLDSPIQNIFHKNEHNHHKRKPQLQQFLTEGSFKASSDTHKHNVNQFRYEAAPSKSQTNTQYYPDQEMKLVSYERPPPPNQGEVGGVRFVQKPVLTREQAPAVNAPNIYDQYNLPFNGSFYQSLNPTSINQELLNGFQNANNQAIPSAPVRDESQPVQLLYVPLENLKAVQSSTQVPQDSETIVHQINAPRTDNQIYRQNNQHLIDDIEHDLIQQTVQAHTLQQQIHLGRPVVIQTTTTTTTTPKPTKRKPHQPPLAVYLETHKGVTVDDVLDVLKDAKTIAVQDAVLPNSPQVFVGPSALNLPAGYTKFPLPYINKIEANKIERKVESLPFFVAPLSYKTPEGYSKIPLPSPHVGSVVVSNKEDSHKRSAPKPTITYPSQINNYEFSKPSYTAPTTRDNLNQQAFDINQQTYYSKNVFQNPAQEVQKPQYLQFTVNDHTKQFEVPSKQSQDQLHRPQLNVNEMPPAHTQTSHTGNYVFKNPEITHNQAVKENGVAQNILQQSVTNQNLNPYSSSVQDPNKYISNKDQGIKSYEIPTRTSAPSQENIKSYQIPVKSSAGVSQYSQVTESKDDGSNSHRFSSHVPSRNVQRIRHPTTDSSLQSTSSPSRSSSSYLNEPSSTFLSSPFDDTYEVNITPKTTTTNKPSIEPYNYPYDTGHKKQNPLDLAINQYELHQINSQLVEDNTEKDTTKNPYDFSSQYNYDGKPKDFDYNSKYEVETSKVKGKYDYSSIFDVETDKPKYDFGSEYERYSSTPASILRDIYDEVTTTARTPKARRRGKPTRQPSRLTTESSFGKESYTILEEFSAKSVTTPNGVETKKEGQHEAQYQPPTQTEHPDIPTNVYRIRTTTPKYETIKVDPETRPHENPKTDIEVNPANVYSLNVNQNAQIYTTANDQQHQNNFGRNEEVSQPPAFVQSPLTEVSYSPQYNEKSIIEPLVQNRGQKQQENEYNYQNKQTDFSDYTANLQDQSVRTLLVPNLLVPTTEHHHPTPNYELSQSEQSSPITTTTTTTTTMTTTTTTEQPPTTHVTRGRGRQRGSSRFAIGSGSTTSSAPRRNVNRRRPVHTSRTTTTTTTTDNPNQKYSSREDVPRLNTRQRFRTRGRQSQTTVADRVSSTENEVRSYTEPTSRTSYEIQTEMTVPQSYMKFEHTIENQKIVIQPDELPVTDYPQYYNPQLPPVTVTDNPRLYLQYDNTATTQNPIMDVQITHTAPKTRKQTVTQTTNRPNSEESEEHYQSGGALRNNYYNEEEPSRKTNRVRGRGRSRVRVATTTTTEKTVARTTARPAIRIAPKRTTTASTTTTTTTHRTPAKSAAEEEFFGFIRQPNFNQIYNIPVPAATQQPVQIYQPNQNQPSDSDVRVSTYQVIGSANKNPNVQVQSYQIPQNQQQPLDDVTLDFNHVPSDSSNVQFVGEIRPKYRPTTQNYEEIVTTDSIEPETARPRVRGRGKAPQRKSPVREFDNEISTSRIQQATRRSNAVRSRGRVHYRPPEDSRLKVDKEGDIEGENYPPSFFQNRQATSSKTPAFQISIDPGNEEETDQLPNPSLYQPKVLPRPIQWTEATKSTADGEANDLNQDIHLEGETVSPNDSQNTDQTTDQPLALPITVSDEQTTGSSDEAYAEDTKAVEKIFEEVNKTEEPKPKGKGRRRGVWKLVRQRPIDEYEVAESQSYYSVVNAFGDIVKVPDRKKQQKNEVSEIDNQVTEDGLGQQELYNNYNVALEQDSETYDYESQKLPSTEHPTKYYEVYDLNIETENIIAQTTTVTPSTDNSTESDMSASTTSKGSSIFDSLYEMFGISDKTDEDKTGQPTTTTTETETIPPPTTTTIISPTFPEEITEVPTTFPPTTTFAKEPASSSSIATENLVEKLVTTTPKTQIIKSFEVEPWEMKEVRTSTSTEVSHETEICYKGRCVKSTGKPWF